jgi:beta-glucuronidase
MARLADQMGLLVWEEIPVYWGIDRENESTLQISQSQMEELIARDQNRTSAILWSLERNSARSRPP